MWHWGLCLFSCHTSGLGFFFKANLWFPERAVFKMPVGVWGWSGDCWIWPQLSCLQDQRGEMDPTENSLVVMNTWKFSFVLHPQITEDFSMLWDVLKGFFPRLNSFIIPFAVPLGESQASHLLWDWRLRMAQPQILSCFWVFLFLPGLLPCVSCGCVLWDALGPCDAARAGAELCISGRDGLALLCHLYPISLGVPGGGELAP